MNGLAPFDLSKAQVLFGDLRFFHFTGKSEKEESTMEKSRLETIPIPKLMRKYALPCVISLLVAALYFGQQVYDIIFVHDNVANFMHIVGGLCGTAFGYYSALHSRRKPAKAVKFTSSNRRRKH